MKETNKDVVDPKFFNLVSQIAHFFTMYGLVFTAGKFFGHWGVIIVAVLGVLYAAVHEFIWDPMEENAVTRGSDTEDFAFLVLGVAVGVLVYLL